MLWRYCLPSLITHGDVYSRTSDPQKWHGRVLFAADWAIGDGDVVKGCTELPLHIPDESLSVNETVLLLLVGIPPPSGLIPYGSRQIKECLGLHLIGVIDGIHDVTTVWHLRQSTHEGGEW